MFYIYTKLEIKYEPYLIQIHKCKNEAKFSYVAYLYSNPFLFYGPSNLAKSCCCKADLQPRKGAMEIISLCRPEISRYLPENVHGVRNQKLLCSGIKREMSKREKK